MPLSEKERRKEVAEKVKELMKRVSEKHKTIYRPIKSVLDTKPIIIDRGLYPIREVPEN